MAARDCNLTLTTEQTWQHFFLTNYLISTLNNYKKLERAKKTRREILEITVSFTFSLHDFYYFVKGFLSKVFS